MLVRTLYVPHRLAVLETLQDNNCHAVLFYIQNLLAARGWYHHTATGVYDADTRAAIACFQQSEDLPATGILDPVTYCRLEPAATAGTPLIAAPRERTGLTPTSNRIVIIKSQRALHVLNGSSPLQSYPVGIGKPHTPTPVGRFAIATKIFNPGGILGTRWLGLNYQSYGIHGTNQPWLIGQMVSHGCIRMHNADVEQLFNMVLIGTPVLIRN